MTIHPMESAVRQEREGRAIKTSLIVLVLALFLSSDAFAWRTGAQLF